MLDIITDNLDVWTTAKKNKKAVGRGSSKKQEAYGIKKLRELILELAVRGKLVPQDPGDEPANVLLERISKEKQRLIEEGKIKKQKTLPEIGENEISYILPNGWKWVRFGIVAQHNSGKTLDGRRNSGQSRKYLTTSNLYWGKFKLDQVREMLIRKDELIKCSARINDLLICEGGEAGRAAVWPYDEEICFQNHVHRARFYCEINSYYGYRFFEKISATGEINKHRKGVGISNMSGKALSLIIFPLPPINEQHRIVAKVDELMALCDQLEQQQSDQSATQKTLVETLLNGLIESAKTSENDQQSTSDFFNQLIAQHFDTLFTTEQSIDQLKQTTLQLAVMGKLVPQDPKDEPASVLLEKIAEEKTRLIEAGKIKKQKPIINFESLDDLKGGNIPNHWNWVRLVDIADIVRGGSPRPAGDIRFYDGNIPFLKVADVSRVQGKMVEGFNFTIKEAGLKKTRFINQRTVLLTNSGATLGIPAICDFDATFNDGIAAFVELSEFVFDEYLYLYLKSLSKWFLTTASRGQGQPNLNTDIIKATWFALPPLVEQKYIVKKVDKLLTLCDTLKANLNQAQTTQTQLADAIVKQAVN